MVYYLYPFALVSILSRFVMQAHILYPSIITLFKRSALWTAPKISGESVASRLVMDIVTHQVSFFVSTPVSNDADLIEQWQAWITEEASKR